MAKNGTLATSKDLQPSFQLTGKITIGIDLGDRFSHCCVLGTEGEVLTEGRVRSTPEAMARCFQELPPCRIAIEVGSHSRWLSRLLAQWGHEVIVANSRNLRLISENTRKSDEVDARILARLARVDPKLLSPVAHRAEESYPDMAQLRARDLLVKTRTRLINAVRGMLKSVGLRAPVSSAGAFAGKVAGLVPDELKPGLIPLLETITHLTGQISIFEKAIDHIGKQRYPETKRLRQVTGVGPITALQFVLTIGDPNRFRRSRDIGSYLGLAPAQHQSGQIEHQLRISKAGDRSLRALLVQCAQYMMGRFGPDSDLKRWGLRLAERGGKSGRKRAVVAVARKLAILLHRLWVTGDIYRPLQNTALTCRASEV